jgi:PAS domain-containing protein
MKQKDEGTRHISEGQRVGAEGGISAEGKKRSIWGNAPANTRSELRHPLITPNPTPVETLKGIAATIREPLVVLDKSPRVLSANRNFNKFFKVKAGETVGRLIYDLGKRQWDIPTLRAETKTILPQKAVINEH